MKKKNEVSLLEQQIAKSAQFCENQMKHAERKIKEKAVDVDLGVFTDYHYFRGARDGKKEDLKLIADDEKTRLQQKAKIVFKIRKMIDDWEKKSCIEPKCHGLLNCKLCIGCEIGMKKDAYKDVLKILDKPPTDEFIIVPRELLPEKHRSRELIRLLGIHGELVVTLSGKGKIELTVYEPDLPRTLKDVPLKHQTYPLLELFEEKKP